MVTIFPCLLGILGLGPPVSSCSYCGLEAMFAALCMGPLFPVWLQYGMRQECLNVYVGNHSWAVVSGACAQAFQIMAGEIK